VRWWIVRDPSGRLFTLALRRGRFSQQRLNRWRGWDFLKQGPFASEAEAERVRGQLEATAGEVSGALLAGPESSQ
jgi:hypothetical protein